MAAPAGAAASSGTATTGLAAAHPSILAPSGRWAKAAVGTGGAASKGGAEGDAKNEGVAPTLAAAAAGGAPTAAAASSEKPAAATPTAPTPAESEEELVEETGTADVEMEQAVEDSIRKLPEEDQRRIRNVLRTKGRRGGDDGEDTEGDSRRRERERSPRPTNKKIGGDNEEDEV